MRRTFTKYPSSYVKASSDLSDYKGTFTIHGGEYFQPRNLELDGDFRIKETKTANSVKDAARIAKNMKQPYIVIVVDEYPSNNITLDYYNYWYSQQDIEDYIKDELNAITGR